MTIANDSRSHAETIATGSNRSTLNAAEMRRQVAPVCLAASETLVCIHYDNELVHSTVITPFHCLSRALVNVFVDVLPIVTLTKRD